MNDIQKGMINMSKMTKSVKEQRKTEIEKPVENFMGGTSYEYNPLDTLRMVTASSIFGEPQYYRDGEFKKAGIKDGKYCVDEWKRLSMKHWIMTSKPSSNGPLYSEMISI